ncbi:MAG: glycosyltransferase [Muribaculaceae bacterium]|nr:glycosyltransferase [Muribaculaceae bacterium]
MKRILFYSESFCGEKVHGGLESATYRLAKALKESGRWEVYDAFRSMGDGKEKSIYKKVIKLGKSNSVFVKQLASFIRDEKIDVIVNMTRFYRHKYIIEAIKRSGREVKVVFMQHFAPGSEMKKPTYKSGFHLLKLNPYNPLYWLRASIYPLIKLHRNRNWGKIYKSVYESSNKVVLLSEGYIDGYKEVAGLEVNGDKFIAIPNIFELPSEHRDFLPKKQKRVLIMSRMDEIQKRVSLALRIWKIIEEEPDLQDWHLDIVGTGHDIALEKRVAKLLQLKNITFHGWGDRDEFLGKSPILLMTSEYEGLPLTILEALAYSCVPIAYDSYASLKDVVANDINGITVSPFGDIEGFAEKLKSLMRDKERREELGKNASLTTENFSSKRIGDKWLELLENL